MLSRTPTISITILKGDEKNGKVPIYLQFIRGRKVNRISLKKKIPIECWCGNEVYVYEKGKNKYPNARQLNNWLNKIYIKAEGIILSDPEPEKLLFSKFKDLLEGKKAEDFFDYHFRLVEQKKKNGVGESTLLVYGVSYSRLKKFSEKISLHEIDRDWILEFESFMREKLNLHTNSIYKTLSHTQAVLHLARKRGVINSNPFEDYKINRVTEIKVFLTKDEVKSLDALFHSGALKESLQNILRQFLFSCFTGLSFADMVTLSYENIQNMDGNFIIIKKRQKTNVEYVIPIPAPALKYLDLSKKEGLAFCAISNQKTNDYLKELCKFVGIGKRVTFHTARHTCGTLLINSGVPKNIVQTILGHKKSEMTDHYAKLAGQTVINQIDKFNKNWSHEQKQEN